MKTAIRIALARLLWAGLRGLARLTSRLDNLGRDVRDVEIGLIFLSRADQADELQESLISERARRLLPVALLARRSTASSSTAHPTARG